MRELENAKTGFKENLKKWDVFNQGLMKQMSNRRKST